MASVALIWHINYCRYQQAEKAASTVPSTIRNLFKNPNVHTKRPVLALEKIAKLLEGGADKLEVITDLDRTLKSAGDEDRLTSTIDALDNPLANRTVSSTPRPNLILIGDSMDALKTEANSGREVVLRIGFLNRESENLDLFLAGYDIVISNEHSMDLPMRIIEEIVGAKRS